MVISFALWTKPKDFEVSIDDWAMRANRLPIRLNLIWALIVALALTAACGSADDEPEATAVDDDSAPVANTPDDEDVVGATRSVDLTGIARADAETARSIFELAGSQGDDNMEPGPWFSSGFSQPLAFDLPVRARLVEQGRGSLLLEIGTPGEEDHGLLRVVEAVAFASPNGPVPISQVGPEAEFSDTTLLDQGLADTTQGELSWRDVIIESDLVPEVFQQACLADTTMICVDGPISEGGGVGVELDRPTRFVAQQFGSRRLYVIATALGADPVPVASELSAFAHAFHIAATVSTTDRSETTERLPLATLGNRVGPVPAGVWHAALDGVDVEFELDSDTQGMRVHHVAPRYVAFEVEGSDGASSRFFAVQVFQGFVDGVLPAEHAGTALPLSTELYLEGVANVVDISNSGKGAVGGLESTWYEVVVDTDSPFACQAAQRPPSLAPDVGCVIYSVDGWMYTGAEADSVEYRSHYIEDLGVEVSYPGRSSGDAFDVLEDFRSLVEGLRISRADS